MYVLTKKQRDFLETLLSFENRNYFLTTMEELNDPNELSVLTECVSRGTYTQTEKIILNDVADYFRRNKHKALRSEDGTDHFEKYRY